MDRKLRVDADMGRRLWCFSTQAVTDIYGAIIYSSTKESLDFLWYGIHRKISEFQVWGCHIEALIGAYKDNLADRGEFGYYMGTTATRAVIQYWNPNKPNIISYCTTAKFNEHETINLAGKISSGSRLTNELSRPEDFEVVELRHKDHPILKHPPTKIEIILPQMESHSVSQLNDVNTTIYHILQHCHKDHVTIKQLQHNFDITFGS